ncbi:transmembrane protein-like [Tropilaelaps mercedesae]|uniref:Transmembrane protein-like n=1 Tax=Tropilaelaps mercedesae TaxID=418985 RepID=A0A1V9XCC2_9ACAR|nr:transmembrane protein-like [Tropilaelaps mercedesae]
MPSGYIRVGPFHRAMTRVFGVGPGTFLLAFIWTVSTIVAFFFAKSRGNYAPGLGCYVLSLATTSILVSLRKTREGSSIHGYDEDLGYDRMFIPRVFLLTFVIASTIAGVVGLYTTWWTLPQTAMTSKPIRCRRRASSTANNSQYTMTWANITKVDNESQPPVKRDNFINRQDEMNRLRKRY